MADELHFKPATELRKLIQAKGVSIVELTEMFNRRIEEFNPRLNAYLAVCPDQAMDQARAAQDAVQRGEELGPLHGIPVSVKDLEMTKGIPTTAGSALFKDRTPDTGFGRGGAFAPGRGNNPGENQHPRVRPFRDHRKPAGRCLPQSLEHRLHSGRVQRRRGSGPGSRFVHPGHRQRRRGIDPDSGQLQRRVWHQALPGPSTPVRRLRNRLSQPLLPVGANVPNGGGHGFASAGNGRLRLQGPHHNARRPTGLFRRT